MAENDKIKLIKEVAENQVGKPLEDVHNNSATANSSGLVCEALDQDIKINELATESKPEITVLIGFEGYGKTSFVASFYHQFLANGNIEGYRLIDSSTLVGLERRLFLRRISGDGRMQPYTKRTLRREPYILSFLLNSDTNGNRLLIISDRSGEDYTRYASQRDSMVNDLALQNADRVIFFIDSGILTSPKRLGMLNRYKDLAENLAFHNMIKDQTELDILFNKIDLIPDNGEKKNKFEEEKSNITEMLTSKLGRTFDNTFEAISNKENDYRLHYVFSHLLSFKSARKDTMEKVDLDWIKHIFKL